MDTSKIKVGGTYTALVQGDLVNVKVEKIDKVKSALTKRPKTLYRVRNLKTKRMHTFSSPTKFKGAVLPKTRPSKSTKKAKEVNKKVQKQTRRKKKLLPIDIAKILAQAVDERGYSFADLNKYPAALESLCKEVNVNMTLVTPAILAAASGISRSENERWMREHNFRPIGGGSWTNQPEPKAEVPPEPKKILKKQLQAKADSRNNKRRVSISFYSTQGDFKMATKTKAKAAKGKAAKGGKKGGKKKATVLSLQRDDVLALFKELGFKKAEGWDNDDLADKLRNIEDIADDETEAKTEEGQETLDKIREAVENEYDIAVVGKSKPAKADKKSKAAASKKAKAGKKAKEEDEDEDEEDEEDEEEDEDDEDEEDEEEEEDEDEEEEPKKKSKKGKAKKGKKGKSSSNGVAKDPWGSREGTSAAEINKYMRAKATKKGKTASEIAEALDLKMTRVSAHIRWMQENDFIKKAKDGKGFVVK